MYWIGLMSGTSLDGVDAVVADFQQTPMLQAQFYLPYPADLRASLLALHTPQLDELHQSQQVSVRLAHVYAQAVAGVLAAAQLSATDITAIGCHGQTVRHRPEAGYTLQLGQGAWLAELSQITVVSDFRTRDIAAGGQGAPLVPAFHAGLFGQKQAQVVVNIGGIANVTVLAPESASILGFDTGPGNLLLDAWCARHLGTQWDENGHWAAQGKVLPELLASWLADPYFALTAPKSTGRDYFNLAWVDAAVKPGMAPVDVQATLLALTVSSIAQAVTQVCPLAERVLVCGGGAHNGYLMAQLTQALPQTKVMTTAALGVDPDWVEALAFAWLAQQTWHKRSGNLPAVTGARGMRVLGAIYPA